MIIRHTKRMIWIVGSLAIVIILVGGLLMFNTTTKDHIDAVWRSYRQSLEKSAGQDNFSGAALIAKNDDVILKQGYGFANAKEGIGNTPDTKFDIASMGKMITAVAIGQLVQQGKLSFDDTIDKHVSGFPSGVAEQITIHQLLTHTAGFGNVALSQGAGHNPSTTLAEQMAEIVRAPLQFTPALRHQYGNDNFVILGAIIEKVSGQSYVNYVREHIFVPANMTHTGIRNYRPSEIPGMALGYSRASAGSANSSSWIEGNQLEIGSPAGGAYSTVGDMYNFARALISFKLLSKEYTSIVTTGKIDTGRPGPATSEKYGYGFNERIINGVRIIGHNGGNPDYEAHLDIYPDEGYIVVLLANRGRVLLPIIQEADAILAEQVQIMER